MIVWMSLQENVWKIWAINCQWMRKLRTPLSNRKWLLNQLLTRGNCKWHSAIMKCLSSNLHPQQSSNSNQFHLLSSLNSLPVCKMPKSKLSVDLKAVQACKCNLKPHHFKEWTWFLLHLSSKTSTSNKFNKPRSFSQFLKTKLNSSSKPLPCNNSSSSTECKVWTKIWTLSLKCNHLTSHTYKCKTKTLNINNHNSISNMETKVTWCIMLTDKYNSKCQICRAWIFKIINSEIH